MAAQLDHYIENLARLATFSLLRFQGRPKAAFAQRNANMSQPLELAEILNAFASAPDSGRPELTPEDEVLVRLMRQALQPGGASVSLLSNVRQQCGQMSDQLTKGAKDGLDEGGLKALEDFCRRFADASTREMGAHDKRQKNLALHI